mgnify:CR=1 FL=1
MRRATSFKEACQNTCQMTNIAVWSPGCMDTLRTHFVLLVPRGQYEPAGVPHNFTHSWIDETLDKHFPQGL